MSQISSKCKSHNCEHKWTKYHKLVIYNSNIRAYTRVCFKPKTDSQYTGYIYKKMGQPKIFNSSSSYIKSGDYVCELHPHVGAWSEIEIDDCIFKLAVIITKKTKNSHYRKIREFLSESFDEIFVAIAAIYNGQPPEPHPFLSTTTRITSSTKSAKLVDKCRKATVDLEVMNDTDKNLIHSYKGIY